MSPRSIRRAAERKARKEEAREARRLAQQTGQEAAASVPVSEMQDFSSEAPDFTATMSAAAAASALDSQSPDAPAHEPSISPAQLAANRANAQLSTGPTSSAGKAKSCLNAVKTGLTGVTVLLPADDAAEYQHHILAYEKELRPVGRREADLVQSIADTAWRLKRIPALEMAIFSRGYHEFADKFQNEDPSRRGALIEMEAFLKYEKQLRNLQLQEARLARRHAKEYAELKELQKQREQERLKALHEAAQAYAARRHPNQSANASAIMQRNGFEFSIAEIERHLGRIRNSHLSQKTLRSAAA